MIDRMCVFIFDVYYVCVFFLFSCFTNSIFNLIIFIADQTRKNYNVFNFLKF